MKKAHVNQLRQLLKLNPATARRILRQFQPNYPDETVKLIVGALKRANSKLAPTSPPRSDTCIHCGQGWRKCGCEQMGEGSVPEAPEPYQARTINIGQGIIEMLGQSATEPQPITPPTSDERERGYDFALSNQQPEKRIGTIPATWF